MHRYSRISEARLSTCDERIQTVMRYVLPHFDHQIIYGHRGKDAQNTAFAIGASQKKWPNSSHNTEPSRAVDVAPYPYNPKDTERIMYFAGFVMMAAATLGIPLIWGGDWNRNTEIKDTNFRDLFHFELADE